MFIGHFAVGFASKRFEPRASLAVLLAAPLFSDLLWPLFLLLGWEHVRIAPGDTRFTPLDLYDFPWSHSLLMVLLWATLFALAYGAWMSDRMGATVIWVGVVSHWVLDWITHRPDMPLYPGGHGGIPSPPQWLLSSPCFASECGSIRKRQKQETRSVSTHFGRMWSCSSCCIRATASALRRRAAMRFSSIAIVATVVLLAWAWWFDRHRAKAV
jgi:hypothetical protein